MSALASLSGELVALQVLTNALNYLKVQKMDICQGML